MCSSVLFYLYVYNRPLNDLFELSFGPFHMLTFSLPEDLSAIYFKILLFERLAKYWVSKFNPKYIFALHE